MRVGQSTKKNKGNMRTFREVLCRVLTGSHLSCISACCPMKHKFWELGAVEAVYTSPSEHSVPRQGRSPQHRYSFDSSTMSALIGRTAVTGYCTCVVFLLMAFCSSSAQLSRQYGTLQCKKGVWLMLQLYGACVLPAGSFACELWGVWLLRGQSRKTRERLSTVYHGHLSSLSGVRRTVPTPILLEELGQQPLADMWLLRASGFWNSLMTGSAFHKAMAQDAVQLMQVTGTLSWVAGLSKALQTAGYAFQPQHLQGIDIGRLQALLTDGRQRVWGGLDICPRTTPSQGARKCTYVRWFRKPSWAGASPLTLPLAHAAMQRFMRFCTGCHGLPKDVGSQSGVPRHQRVCQLCGTGFGDEMHLVFKCAAMADLRGQFPDIFQPHQTMQQFMWQPNLLQVAKFVDESMKRLQTVDPNDGSNL